MAADGTSLEMRIIDLEDQLKRQGDQLKLAVEYGSQLLENNRELTHQQEALTTEMNKKTEEKEQECYSLKMKIDSQEQMLREYIDEVDYMKSRLEKEQKSKEHTMDTGEHHKAVTDLKKEITRLECELEKAQLVEQQNCEEKEQLEAMLKAVHGQLEAKVNGMNETCSEELANMNTELATLQQAKTELTRELCETKNSREIVELEVGTLRKKLHDKDQETEILQCQITSYINAVEKCREEIVELKMELDLATMESQSLKKKGNSLFSEVEDRRVEAEKELITIRLQHESLKKQHSLTKQQLHRVKVQQVALLQMARGKADTEYLDHLRQRLAVARDEIQTLTAKLDRSEKAKLTERDFVADFSKACGSEVTDKDYVGFFKALLKRKEEDLQELQRDLQATRLAKISSCRHAIDLERQLHQAERCWENCQAKNMNLQLRIDELKLKYELDSVDEKPALNIKSNNIERIPLARPVDGECKENVNGGRRVGGVTGSQRRGPAKAALPLGGMRLLVSAFGVDGVSTRPPAPPLQHKSLKQAKTVRIAGDVTVAKGDDVVSKSDGTVSKGDAISKSDGTVSKGDGAISKGDHTVDKGATDSCTTTLSPKSGTKATRGRGGPTYHRKTVAIKDVQDNECTTQ